MSLKQATALLRVVVSSTRRLPRKHAAATVAASFTAALRVLQAGAGSPKGTKGKVSSKGVDQGEPVRRPSQPDGDTRSGKHLEKKLAQRSQASGAERKATEHAAEAERNKRKLKNSKRRERRRRKRL